MTATHFTRPALFVFTCVVVARLHSPLSAAEPDLAAAAARVQQIVAHRGASAERPECTMAAIRRAVEVGATAVEVDVRTSRDGRLFILHDATLDRTTNGTGPAAALTLKQLQQLDAGSWFSPQYREERIPTLIQVAEFCRGKIDVLLDLKEQGDEYDRHVARIIREHGDPERTIVGVRSVPQAKRFRELLPQARQLALIPTVDAIEDFARAGVDTIRLWPRWLEDGNEPVRRVRATGKQLHLNGTTGSRDELRPLLAHRPESLSSDDPGRLKQTLRKLAGDAPAERPNFVVIMADDLGYGDIGCYGNERIATPHLDRLAAHGLRFTDFHSSGAVCSPTRAGLMTGRYQQRAGIPAVIFADPKQPTHPHGLQDREVTFAELLSTAGYKTAIFGKWHLGYYKPYNPVRHGFDQFRGYISGNVDFFSHVDQAGRLDWYRDEEIDDEPGYTTHLITKYSVDFLNAHHDQPFCLYVPYEPPHYPYQGPNDAPVRRVGTPRGKAETQQSREDIQRAYKEMVEEMDTGIGEIVAALKQHGIERNTLVLFFSDNGGTPRGSNGPLRGHKGQLWEGGHRVPCIASWPGTIEAGRVSSELATTLDVMPTLLAAAGIEPPADRPLDGASLMPLLTEGAPLGQRTIFWGHGNSCAMRDGPWKLVLNAPGQPQPGLYHLADDLAEQHDLAAKEPARVNAMRTAIEQWTRDVTATATAQPDTPPGD